MSAADIESILSGIRALLTENNKEIKELRKMLKSNKAPTSEEPTKKKSSSKKKKTSESGSDVEKKPSTNPWILFTKRVEELVRAHEEALETPPSSKMKTTVVKQFASHLKSQKAYADWSDDEIQVAISDFTPPEVSKKEAKKSASEKSNIADSAESSAAEEEVVKPKVKKPVKKPSKSLDLKFRSWKFDSKDYYKNERGDVLSSELEWVGLFNGSSIDESAPQPEDIAEAKFADE